MPYILNESTGYIDYDQEIPEKDDSILALPAKFGILSGSSVSDNSRCRGLGHSRVQHRCGRHIIRAVGKSYGKSEDKDQPEDDALQATIQKSNKVFAMQRELLQ
ncbi:hypothetical protein HN51_016040 [Arachis hypogaea]